MRIRTAVPSERWICALITEYRLASAPATSTSRTFNELLAAVAQPRLKGERTENGARPSARISCRVLPDDVEQLTPQSGLGQDQERAGADELLMSLGVV